jgi:hypothetical protein
MKRHVEPNPGGISVTILEVNDEEFDKLAGMMHGLDHQGSLIDDEDIESFKESRMILNISRCNGTRKLFEKLLIETKTLSILVDGHDYGVGNGNKDSFGETQS